MAGRRAFTLMETLVVMAILALLAALAGPALVSARGAARAIACTSNTGQLATAAVLYAQDHRDRLWRSSEWIKVRKGQAPPTPGAIHDYIDSADVLECPENRRRRSGVEHPGGTVFAGLYPDLELDTDYSHVHNISGVRLDVDLQAGYLTDPASAGTWWGRRERTGSAGLERLRGVPLFVEESTAWSNEEDGWNTWIGPDQLTRRHGGASIAFLDTHAETFLPPGDPDEAEVTEADLTSVDVYVSSDGGAWYMLGWPNPYPEGWANNPR